MAGWRPPMATWAPTAHDATIVFILVDLHSHMPLPDTLSPGGEATVSRQQEEGTLPTLDKVPSSVIKRHCNFCSTFQLSPSFIQTCFLLLYTLYVIHQEYFVD